MKRKNCCTYRFCAGVIAGSAALPYFAFKRGPGEGFGRLPSRRHRVKTAQMPLSLLRLWPCLSIVPFGFGGLAFGGLGLAIPLFLLFLAMKAFRFNVSGVRAGDITWAGPRSVGTGMDVVKMACRRCSRNGHKPAHGEPAEEKKE